MGRDSFIGVIGDRSLEVGASVVRATDLAVAVAVTRSRADGYHDEKVSQSSQREDSDKCQEDSESEDNVALEHILIDRCQIFGVCPSFPLRFCDMLDKMML